MPLHLTYRAGAITGFIDRKIVNCLVRPTQPGKIPGPGEYLIGAPVNDLIYGPVAMMVRAGAGVDPGVVQECVRRLPAGGAANTLFNPTGGRMAAGIAEMTKQEMPGTVALIQGSAPVPGGAVFVLASRPIAGQNCLLAAVSSGLFEAIAAGGGAVITVYSARRARSSRVA